MHILQQNYRILGLEIWLPTHHGALLGRGVFDVRVDVRRDVRRADPIVWTREPNLISRYSRTRVEIEIRFTTDGPAGVAEELSWMKDDVAAARAVLEPVPGG